MRVPPGWANHSIEASPVRWGPPVTAFGNGVDEAPLIDLVPRERSVHPALDSVNLTQQNRWVDRMRP